MQTDEILTRLKNRFKSANVEDYRPVFQIMTGEDRAKAYRGVMEGWGGTTPPAPKKFVDALKANKAVATKVEGKWPWELRSEAIAKRTEQITDDWMRRNPGYGFAERARIREKAFLVAQVEQDWPEGHPCRWKGAKPESMIAYANRRLGVGDTDEWLTHDELVDIRASAAAISALKPLPGQGQKNIARHMANAWSADTDMSRKPEDEAPPDEDVPPLSAYDDGMVPA